MGKKSNTKTSNDHGQHRAVPPYLLASMAACDGAWEAPESMRTFMARAPRGEANDPVGPRTRTRIAARARQTLLLDQALRHERQRGETPAQAIIIEPSGSLQRTISDAQGVEVTPGILARAEGGAPVDDDDVNRAYDGLGAVHEFLADQFKRSSLDGAGLALRGTVHYGQEYDNAFWDGTQVVMGDGDGEIFNSFTSSLSVIAHELGHGLLQYTTNLKYRGQSGSLNESIADVLGALVEQFAAGEDAASASWLIGKGLFHPRVNAKALRSMAAPGTAYDDPLIGRDPQPAHMDSYIHTKEDSGGVHLNSGIPNHAFYLFATALGGHAWERAGSVWFNVVVTRSIPEDSNFATFAGQTLLQARRDYGVGSVEDKALAAAWDGVGVVPQVKDEQEAA
ncbi:M4 family metallopeptidase [Paeniglutamicibacter kerguelensis]|uniref:Neutral metalloproteinase n=1 Tax=Paeniglutamicibacter kerguelensis TaxID=254788 RepID=A0ABS4XIW5_9MICC|nr:M4 family metallopeptidase [Paeniglutamicibacter kerguelensis]MBP2388306.1 Zn-dependent metalloprotease [Paeniglutamicibacter kerguelensis]